MLGMLYQSPSGLFATVVYKQQVLPVVLEARAQNRGVGRVALLPKSGSGDVFLALSSFMGL